MTQPVLTTYDQDHLHRIALPLGGIGTGTVSLGGRGDLRDWEIMNRPAKGFTPKIPRQVGPSFVLNMKSPGREPVTRVCEGPLELCEYEGDMGSDAKNHGMPRFSNCSFGAAYPFGQVNLSDPKTPLDVTINAFNPLIPADADASGIPIAVLRFELRNRSRKAVTATLCASLPNFIGNDGTTNTSCDRRNRFRKAEKFCGILMDAKGLKDHAPQQGTIALTTLSKSGVSYRTDWNHRVGWGSAQHDFWKDLQADGALTNPGKGGGGMPMASLAVKTTVPAGKTKEITFLLTWHFPNRQIWSPSRKECKKSEVIGNYYATQYRDAWDVVRKTVPKLKTLEKKTALFVDSLCGSDLPHEVKEAALFNVSTLRTQTCFRTPDGHLYGWEGCMDKCGCCSGSCTHVWNYEQATAFLFGDLALGMRKIEFAHATDRQGKMAFRVMLPLKSKARKFGAAAADGQMGCIMKMYRDWQLSGDTAVLKKLWPNVKKALAFCWIKGGWDADRDGVMEGCQHNTMDVEYFGPNPQMTGWYLGALRAAEEMALALGDEAFAKKCRGLFENGSAWMDEHLFNGEYYEHHIQPMKEKDIAPGLLLKMGNIETVDFQLGKGCLVDQLVGQYMAHVCGLGYLHDKRKVAKTLKSIVKYNQRKGMRDHFNCMRSYVLGDESALLMAAYPGEIPENPFPYFTEVMTGFEYTAAIGMLFEGQVKQGVECIRNIRERYDGRRRSPFDEAECGHHYARAMASWAAILALTGFLYSAVDKVMVFTAKVGTHFWSTGYAWGTCKVTRKGKSYAARLKVLGGKLPKGTKVFLVTG